MLSQIKFLIGLIYSEATTYTIIYNGKVLNKLCPVTFFII